MLFFNNTKNNFLNIKRMKGIIINNWKRLETSTLILKIRKNWVQNLNLVIFIFYKKKDREIIEILDNFLIKGNNPMNNSDLDSNKSGDDFIFKLDINFFPMLYFIISKFIIINNNSEEEDLLNSRFSIIDSIGRKSRGKGR
jgi:hypothetical protein